MVLRGRSVKMVFEKKKSKEIMKTNPHQNGTALAPKHYLGITGTKQAKIHLIFIKWCFYFLYLKTEERF